MKESEFLRFQILQQLGNDIFSSVYQVFDSERQQEAALRVIPLKNLHDLTFFSRYDREMQLVQMISPPGVAPVWEVGEHLGCLYILSPYYSGGSLEDKLKQGPMPLDEALPIVKQIAAGLDSLHGLGLVHRDIRPANVFFDGDGGVYLADYGLYKLVESCLPPGHFNIIGSPKYNSPEQSLQKIEVDSQTDVYSLGVVLFEMLAGQPPYDSKTALGQAVSHFTWDIPSICSINPGLPVEIDEILGKALAKNPAERLGRAGDLADALEKVAAGQQANLEYPPIPANEMTPVSISYQSLVLPPPYSPAEEEILLPLPEKRRDSRFLWVVVPLLMVFLAVGGYFVGVNRQLLRPLDFDYLMNRQPKSVVIFMTATGQSEGSALETSTMVPAVVNQNTHTPTLPNTEEPTVVSLIKETAPVLITPTPVPTQTRIPTLTPTSGPSPTPLPVSHKINYYETFFTIASTYQVEIGDLVGFNSMYCGSQLYPGKDLLLPPPRMPIPTPAIQEINQYSVTSLENLRVLDCAGKVSDLAFSPDGKVLASAERNYIFLWQVGSWLPLRRVGDHQATITALAFSPDGTILATGSEDSTVRLWDVSDGTELAVLKGHRRAVTDVAFSPDGRMLVSTSLDQSFKIWNVETQALEKEVKGYVSHSAVFTGDGRRLVVGFIEFIRVYDVSSWEVLQEYPVQSPVTHLKFSPDELLLTSSSYVWQFLDGRIHKLIYRFKDSSHKTSILPDGQGLLIGRQVWKLSNGRMHYEMISPIPETEKTTYAWESTAISPDGKLLAWGTEDGLFIMGVVNAKTLAASPQTQFVTFIGEDNFYNAALASSATLPDFLNRNQLSCDNEPFVGQVLARPDSVDFESDREKLSQQVVISSENIDQLNQLFVLDMLCADAVGPLVLNANGIALGSGAAVWDIARESILIKNPMQVPKEEDDPLLPRLSGSPYAVFSPDGLLVAVRAGKEINLWGVDDGKLRRTLKGHTDNVISLAFSPDRSLLASSGNVGEGGVRIWRVSDGEEVQVLEGFSAQWMQFSRDGNLLITLAGDTARIWQLSDGTIQNTVKGIAGEFKVSPNGEWIAYVACLEPVGSRCLNEVVNLYRISGGTVANTFLGVKPVIDDIAFSPDSQLLVGGSADTAVVWDVNTGVILYKMRSPAETVSNTLFTRDGSMLVTVTDKNILRFWELKDGGDPIKTLTEKIGSVVFSADGRVMATVSGDKLKIWGVVP